MSPLQKERLTDVPRPLPARLPGTVVAKLAGRATHAVFRAKADGKLASFRTADVERWVGREFEPLEYLRACRATERKREPTL